MVKATLRSAVLLGMGAITFLMASAPGFAEVQNVKVGGDVTVRTLHRRNLDLKDRSGALDIDNYLMTTTGLNVGADLTENVSAFVRIVNERDWNNQATSGETGSDVDLSQAYVTFKELFYAPLTIKIGAQPIVWGRGLVLGSNLLPTVLSTVGSGADRNGSITSNEFTDFTSFDAIRATLDLGGAAQIGVPLSVDYVYIKMDENLVGSADDVNLQGINLSTHLDPMDSELEAYYLIKRDRSFTNPVHNHSGTVNTWGLRGSLKPVDGGLFWGELAYQYGDKAVDMDGASDTVGPGSGHQAWATDFGIEYTFKDVHTTPKFGGEWIFYSGRNIEEGVVPGAGAGWDPIAPSYFPTVIRAYQTRSTVGGLYPVAQTGVTSAFTNQHQFALYGGLKPIEDLKLDSRLSWFALPVGALLPTSPAGDSKRVSFLGTEWDTWVTYNYTDDVQFGVTYGLFVPGPVFREGGNGCSATTCFGKSTAQELISTVSVKF